MVLHRPVELAGDYRKMENECPRRGPEKARHLCLKECVLAHVTPFNPSRIAARFDPADFLFESKA